MEIHELTLAEIRATIQDMRLQALALRTQAKRAKAAGDSTKSFMLIGEAIVTEHWANRLDNAIARHDGTLPPA